MEGACWRVWGAKTCTALATTELRSVSRLHRHIQLAAFRDDASKAEEGTVMSPSSDASGGKRCAKAPQHSDTGPWVAGSDQSRQAEHPQDRDPR